MGKDTFTVRFWGVRGGYPTPGPTTVRAGGNTTCMEVRVAGHLIVVDAGTGIIRLGQEMMAHYRATGEPLCTTILITHTHHDHTQGFPFFLPARNANSTLYIFGPKLLEEDLQEVLARAMLPPVFPLGLEELYSQRQIRHIRQGDLIVLQNPTAPPRLLGPRDDQTQLPPDAVTVQVYHSYSHPKGGVLVFRIGYRQRSLVVATDTEGYVGGDQRLVRFAQGADLLVHDAEYDEDEYAGQSVIRQGWGHSTWRMAIDVALAAGVKRLALFHHSPSHDDDFLEDMERKAQAVFPAAFLAREGMTVEL
jgi:phosphoribosyl 1,2-cyclic phosphodiesterase